MESGRSRLAHVVREAFTITGTVAAETHPAPTLRIDVLSGDAATATGPIALSPSETAVLVILGLNGRRLHRDVLAAELYGGRDPRNALNSLKVTVHRVRRRAGRPDVIQHDRGRYTLPDWVAIDVPQLPLTFADLCSPSASHALELLRARLRGGRPGFMLEWAWFDETERRLRDLEQDVMLALAHDALRSRRYQAAIDLAHDLARDDPLDESAIEIVVRAFNGLGNGELADLNYRRYASRVERETHSAPSEELRRLVRSRGALSTAAR